MTVPRNCIAEQPGEHGADLVLALLLYPTTDAGPGEGQGVAQPVLLLVQFDHSHGAPGSGLVVLGLGHSGGTDGVEPALELWVGLPIREAGPEDGDAGQHTVVGNHATGEVGLGLQRTRIGSSSWSLE